MTSSDAARHMPADAVEAYDHVGVNGTIVVAGTPAVRLQISPSRHRLTLLVRVDSDAHGPDVQNRANVSYDLQHEAGVMWHRLDVTYEDNLAEVYAILCTVADRVQIGGDTFGNAVDAVLAGLGEILAGRGGLTHEQQVGLFGELVVLLSAAAQTTPAQAVAAWRGPAREEHDFGLGNADVEVKTTMSEHRRHWISTGTQLVPTPGRDLYLLSLQVTGAGNGPGATLADAVAAARALATVATGLIDGALAAAGWRQRHADLYNARWALRTGPEFHLVDQDFPAVTPERLAASVPNANRVTDLRYRVDLDGLVPEPPLFPVTLKVNGASNS
jgi:alpha-ketoglutarate-dependent taurine dioxygenase